MSDLELYTLVKDISNNQLAMSEAVNELAQNQKHSAEFAKISSTAINALQADRKTVFDLRDRIIKLEQDNKRLAAMCRLLVKKQTDMQKQLTSINRSKQWDDLAKQASYEDLL